MIFCHGCLKLWDIDFSSDTCFCHPDIAHHIGTTSVELKTPSEWASDEDVKIIDPDGWRFDERSFEDEICYDEWIWRRNKSTIELRNLPGQQRFDLG